MIAASSSGISFQLPLSGSHIRYMSRVPDRGAGFQLPLSGSHVYHITSMTENSLNPFNSLSRDHGSSSISWIRMSASPFQLPLSGSPACLSCFAYLSESALSTPSLGITTRFRNKMPYRYTRIFQLPLSGSRPTATPTCPVATSTFNSLSRDHRARFRDFPALRGFLPRRPFAQMISKATI